MWGDRRKQPEEDRRAHAWDVEDGGVNCWNWGPDDGEEGGMEKYQESELRLLRSDKKNGFICHHSFFQRLDRRKNELIVKPIRKKMWNDIHPEICHVSNPKKIMEMQHTVDSFTLTSKEMWLCFNHFLLLTHFFTCSGVLLVKMTAEPPSSSLGYSGNVPVRFLQKERIWDGFGSAPLANLSKFISVSGASSSWGSWTKEGQGLWGAE